MLPLSASRLKQIYADALRAHQAGRRAEAEAGYRAVLAANPAVAEAHFQLGRLALDAADRDGAAEHFERAVALRPAEAAIWLHLAMARAGHPDAPGILTRAIRAGLPAPALKQIEARLGLRPPAPRPPKPRGAAAEAVALRRKGETLQRQGDFAAAEKALRRAIALDPGCGDHYRVLGATVKFTAADPLIAAMERRFGARDTADADRMMFGFALAKAMADIGAHDRVFDYLHPANALMRKLYPFDRSSRRRDIAALKQVFAGTDFAARKIAGTSDFRPVFVTGLPRSGTTLVEQIVAAHSAVESAGEVGAFEQTARGVLFPGGRLRPLSAVPDAEIAALGRACEAALSARCPGAAVITDKSVQSYTMIGLIRLALPGARVVVVYRDPRDTALSIYRNVFPEGTHPYAYDLRDIAEYYRLFREIVDFWREVLPPGSFHEIAYEALIADPEGESRRLIAACGLEWEDACLSFHSARRKVETLSLYQVRQPINAASVAGWRRHEDELRPVTEALADLLEDTP